MNLRLSFLALLLSTSAGAADFLDPNQAFRLAAKGSAPGPVELLIDITPGHYMYREKFEVRTADGRQISLTNWPQGESKFDEAFQREMEIHRGKLRVTLQVDAPASALLVTGQGCADKGLCYAPMTSTLEATTSGVWNLRPGSDPAGEFGPAAFEARDATHSSPQSMKQGWALWTMLCGGLFLLLQASRKT